VQPWEVSQQRAADERERLTRTKLTRELFVWVSIPLLDRRRRWVPGVLSEVRRTERGWIGLVAYVVEHYNDGSPHGRRSEWRSHISREWADARRIRVIDPQPERPRA
jgi:hypothetical protein